MKFAQKKDRFCLNSCHCKEKKETTPLAVPSVFCHSDAGLYMTVPNDLVCLLHDIPGPDKDYVTDNQPVETHRRLLCGGLTHN